MKSLKEWRTKINEMPMQMPKEEKSAAVFNAFHNMQSQFAPGMKAGSLKMILNKISQDTGTISFDDQFISLVAHDFGASDSLLYSFLVQIVEFYKRRIDFGIKINIRANDYLDLLHDAWGKKGIDIGADNGVDSFVGASPFAYAFLQEVVKAGGTASIKKAIKNVPDAQRKAVLDRIALFSKANTVKVVGDKITVPPSWVVNMNVRVRRGWSPQSGYRKI